MVHQRVSALLILSALPALTVASYSHPDVSLEQVKTMVERSFDVQPALFVNPTRKQTLDAQRTDDPFFKALTKRIILDADQRLGKKPRQRKLTGRRLLSVSREYLARLLSLGMAYHLTGKAAYFEQAEKEMLAAATFSDWNPIHFLDVAEMTAALGIGYDWFYAELSDDSKAVIRNAIVEKGIKPSQTKSLVKNLGHNRWLTYGSNWNQVCNGGLVIGALAIRREKPELAVQMVHRAIVTIKLPMDEYEPDGAYPEGPGYWEYGTSYNVLLIDALKTVLGTDFGLSERDGFSRSGDYYLHMTAPSRRYFNYSDCGGGGGVSPAMFWFARRYDKPYLVWNELNTLRPDDDGQIARQSNRLFPLLVVWAHPHTAEPPALHWKGRGATPVAVFRSSWADRNAAYLGLKGGRPDAPHGHMDIGSFIYEADGVRWARDLGTQDYTRMEERGLRIWNRRQEGDRWKIFRYNNLSHNTLVVNGQHQRANGFGSLVRFSDSSPMPHAEMDLTDVYRGQLAGAVRRAALLKTRQALIQDELKAGDKAATVRWAMVAPGTVDILTPVSARLTASQKTLRLDVQSPKPIRLKTWSTEPSAEWDDPNPNTCLIGFEVRLEPGEQIRLRVILTPGSAEEKELSALMPPVDWSAPL